MRPGGVPPRDVVLYARHRSICNCGTRDGRFGRGSRTGRAAWAYGKA